MRTLSLLLALSVFPAALGCGGNVDLSRAPSDTNGGGAGSPSGTAGASPGGSTSGTAGPSPGGSTRAAVPISGRVPLHHRATGSTLASQRAPGNGYLYTDGSPCSVHASDSTCCIHDAECTSGVNGRCTTILLTLATACSYDTCATDSDCPARQPCVGRESAADSEPNTCASRSNCRVDADCGAGGFCSPSLIGSSAECSCGDSCAQGYFCHSQADECVDDSDCAGGTCNYDLPRRRWTCSTCAVPL